MVLEKLKSSALFAFLVILLVCSNSKAVESEGMHFSLKSSEFPVGVYMADPFSDKILEELKDAGITYVHSYTPGIDEEKNLALGLKFLDQAEKHGLKMMFTLKTKVYVNKNPEGVRHILNVVKRFGDHPALGFWYLYDEPSESHIGKLEEYYRAIRKETPDIPVAIANNRNKCWQKFYNAMDLQLVDMYPVKDQDFPGAPLRNFSIFVRDALANKKPVMPVVQMYCYKREKERMEREGYNYEKLRYPDRTEFRYFMYSSLAQGARGLFFYSYFRARRDNSEWLKSVAMPEIKEFTGFVSDVRPAHEPAKFKGGSKKGVIASCWKRGEEIYLVLINDEPESRSLRLSASGLAREAELKAIRNSRESDAKISRGMITVKAHPWETFVWKVNRKK